MDNALIPIIITIGISTLITVGSIIGTFVALLNYLSARIEQSEARVTSAAAKDKTELQESIRETEHRLTQRIDQSEERMTQRIDQSEERMTHRMDRFEDKAEAQFEALRREVNRNAAEQPVAGDD